MLKYLKQPNPIELAEYEIENIIQEEKEFNWWVCHKLCPRDRMIYKVKAQYWVWIHKFVISIPKTAK